MLSGRLAASAKSERFQEAGMTNRNKKSQITIAGSLPGTVCTRMQASHLVQGLWRDYGLLTVDERKQVKVIVLGLSPIDTGAYFTNSSAMGMRSGAKAPVFMEPLAVRLKPCPDSNLRGEGKMPSRQPAGRRRYSRFSAVCERRALPATAEGEGEMPSHPSKPKTLAGDPGLATAGGTLRLRSGQAVAPQSFLRRR